MRVIGGQARGRALRAKLPPTVRPTTDFAREAIFSMLESRGGVNGAVVADLYCGSGALGIEALSRGARRVYFVDADPACLAAARANAAPLQLAGEAIFVRAVLPGWVPAEPLDLVLADPPYGPVDIEALLGAAPASRAVIENDRYAEAPPGWAIARRKRYGTTLVTMLEQGASPA
ncbi:MAG: RsmD family RNA methyltransferase [Acidimicrobiales bacterium]